VDVGFLAYFGSFNAYCDGQVQGDSLSDFLYKMIMQKAGQGRNRASRVVEVFGGARAIRRGNLLSSVGGFTAQNAQMLARLLWEDRKMFTAVSVHNWELRSPQSHQLVCMDEDCDPYEPDVPAPKAGHFLIILVALTDCLTLGSFQLNHKAPGKRHVPSGSYST
jgi:hypothetical protein